VLHGDAFRLVRAGNRNHRQALHEASAGIDHRLLLINPTLPRSVRSWARTGGAGRQQSPTSYRWRHRRVFTDPPSQARKV
jgi:hypothetical protein